jgi:hypothetical protein
MSDQQRIHCVAIENGLQLPETASVVHPKSLTVEVNHAPRLTRVLPAQNKTAGP